MLATGQVHAVPIAGEVSGGITLTGQHADDEDIESELLGSFDLFVDAPYLGGQWTLHAEGSTTPRAGYVASLLPEANTDAGTVLTGDHHGHVQVSELKYLYTLDAARTLTVGMLEVPAYMDVAVTAVDENTQFIGLSFKHNLTIEFPDYALGVVYQQQLSDTGPLLTFALSSSHGLADNPTASYAQALNFDDPDKGAFIGLASRWQLASWHAELGAWSHTAPHETLDGSRDDAYNYGAYVVMGREVEGYAFDLRLGAANAEVTQASHFAALSYEWRRPEATYGVGAARTFLSDDATIVDGEDMSQYELYARFQLMDGLELTPHVQRIENSQFDGSGAVHAPEVNIIGVRLAYIL